MAKKKNITEENLISWYMEYVLEHDEPPKSVYKFAKDHNFEENLFYEVFGTFEALEKRIFGLFCDKTLAALEQSKEFPSFEKRDKLLSFYFTFFEMLTANRSYVLHALKSDGNTLKTLEKLSTLRKSFQDFVLGLEFDFVANKSESFKKVQHKSFAESAWIHMLSTIKFWMDDSSPSFEKTDIYIEKSVHASLDLIDVTPLKSVVDFGKFIFKERINI